MKENSLSLYIHLPWCIRKCPYCDFNSHATKNGVPEKDYIDCLMQDLDQNLSKIAGREIQSIFFGGGTPSLFSAEGIHQILEGVSKKTILNPQCEITLEANPGTVEQQRFQGFYQAGINRISLGVQSFQADKLTLLGRIHNDKEAHHAIDAIKHAGFKNFNIDIMHGLPHQTISDAIFDLKQALAHSPTHLSWYQLTIEPNTYFHQNPPTLPCEETLYEIEQRGLEVLSTYGFERYEISAYAIDKYQCRHNMNYWLFGDYLGIGAGAHSKLTDPKTKEIYRHWNYRSPNSYMNTDSPFISNKKLLQHDEIIFEFMLNTLRLFQKIEYDIFEQRTGLPINQLLPYLEKAKSKGLLEKKTYIKTTPLGKKYLDDLCQIFLQK